MEWSGHSNTMDGVTVETEPSARNPNPTLTALLMDSNQPTTADIELTLMELGDDHLNNNFQFSYHDHLLAPQQPPSPPQHSPPSSTASCHSTESDSRSRTFEESIASPAHRRCNCAGADVVTLEQDSNGRTDNLLAEWLTRSARMVRTYPVLASIDAEDVRTLLSSSWKELVILYMAQNDFDFEVHQMKTNINTVCHHKEKSTRKRRAIARMTTSLPSPKHVEQLNFILGKLKQMKLDSKEYALLRLLLLLNTDLRDLKNSNSVVKASEQIHMLLMEYETVCYPSDPLRLSHLLLHLPGVRGFPILAFEQLFYRHLVGDTTVKSVLKELLET